jgi:hypothetical protein
MRDSVLSMGLIPPHYLDAVGVLERGVMAEDSLDFKPIATGTFLGYETPDQSGVEEGATRHAVFLVTNRHVVDGEDELYIRFNQGSGSERFQLVMEHEDGSPAFSVSEHFDLAICPINAETMRDAGADFSVLPERAHLDLQGIQSLEIVGGDAVFTLGFPMGIAGTEKKYAIVRSGVVARVDREIVDETGCFLIDCPVFPGNSGGPVVLRPEALALGNQPPRKKVHVIGIVSGYVPYTDTAISEQTQRPRVSFEENSGLAHVVPMDAVNELVKPIMDSFQDDGQKPASETNAEDEAPSATPPADDLKSLPG